MKTSYRIKNNRLNLTIERYMTAKEATSFVNKALRQNYSDINAAIAGTKHSIYSVERDA